MISKFCTLPSLFPCIIITTMALLLLPALNSVLSLPSELEGGNDDCDDNSTSFKCRSYMRKRFKANSMSLDECTEECNKHRPWNQLDIFTFYCSQVYDKMNSEEANCRNIVCGKCPPSICDQTKSSDIFHCPAMEIGKRCKDQCDSKRPANGSAYLLDCSKEYTNRKLRSQCIDTCVNDCGIICKPLATTSVFHCPRGSPVPGGAAQTSWWFILTVLLVIPVFILAAILLWKTVYRCRNGDFTVTDADQEQHRLSFQQQVSQDPNLFVTPNGDIKPQVALHNNEESRSVMLSNISSRADDVSLQAQGGESVSGTTTPAVVASEKTMKTETKKDDE